jgi:pSer/pThr/pTyr-binding forkhead associated (FHA) protein
MHRFMLNDLARRVAATKSFEEFYADVPYDWLEWDTSVWRPAKNRGERTATSRGSERLAAQPLLYLSLSIPTGAEQCTLGRSVRCDLSLNESTLSSRHLGFKRTGDGWTVEDLGSSNGSTLDGKPLFPPGEARPVHEGVVITAGDLHLTFHTARGLYVMLRELYEKPAGA